MRRCPDCQRSFGNEVGFCPEHGLGLVSTELRTLADLVGAPCAVAEVRSFLAAAAKALAKVPRDRLGAVVLPGDFEIAAPDRVIIAVDLDARMRDGLAARLDLARYRAPEVRGGEGFGEAALVYGLGCIGFALIAGHAPFAGANPAAVAVRKRLEGTPRAPTDGDLAELLAQSMALDPEARPGLDSFAARIVEVSVPQSDGTFSMATPGVPGPTPARGQAGARGRWVGALVALCLAAVAASMVTARSRRAAPPPMAAAGADRLDELAQKTDAPGAIGEGGGGRRIGAGSGGGAMPAVAAPQPLAPQGPGVWPETVPDPVTRTGEAAVDAAQVLGGVLCVLGAFVLTGLVVAFGRHRRRLRTSPREVENPAPLRESTALAPTLPEARPLAETVSGTAVGPPVGPFRVGPYLCEAVLGEGSMGVVYRARHVHLARAAAVKVLLPGAALDAAHLALFRREARLAASVQHPNTVLIYDFDEIEGGLLYLAMELVEGRGLDAHLAEGPLDPGIAGEFVRQLGAGLDAAHGAGVVHRDLKPANVIVTEGPTPRVKIVDFGVARAVFDPRATEAGRVLGTIPYMAPEQARAEASLDARADVFSLGVVAFEMVTGQLPFDPGGRSLSAALAGRASLAAPPPSVRARVPTLPPALDACLQRALHPDPARRTPTAGDFARDFASALTGS